MKGKFIWLIALGLAISEAVLSQSIGVSTPEQDEAEAFGALIQPGRKVSVFEVLMMQGFVIRYLASGRHEDARRVCTAILEGSDAGGAREGALSCLATANMMAGRFDDAEEIVVNLVASSASMKGFERYKYAQNLRILAGLYKERGYFSLASRVLEQARDILESELIPALPVEFFDYKEVNRLDQEDLAKQKRLQGEIEFLSESIKQLSEPELGAPSLQFKLEKKSVEARRSAAIADLQRVTERYLDRILNKGVLGVHLEIVRMQLDLKNIQGEGASGYALLQQVEALSGKYGGSLLQADEAFSGYQYQMQQGNFEEARRYLLLAKAQAKQDIGYPFDAPEPLPSTFNNPAAESLFGRTERSGIAARAMAALGRVYLEEKNVEQASRFLNAAIEGTTFSSGKDSDQVAALQYDLARLDLLVDRPKEALARLRKALSVLLINEEEAAFLPGGRAVELMRTRERVALELIELLLNNSEILPEEQFGEVVFASFQSLHRQAAEASIAAANMRQGHMNTPLGELVDEYLIAGRKLANIRGSYARFSADGLNTSVAKEVGGHLALELDSQRETVDRLRNKLISAGGIDVTASGRKNTLSNTQKVLLPGEVMLQFAFGKERSYVLATTRLDQRIMPIERGRTAFRNDVEVLLRELSPVSQPHEIHPFPLNIAHTLYRDSLFPILSELGHVSRLLVVADGAWEGLPFSVLISKQPEGAFDINDYDKVDWLFRRYEIAYLPSPVTLIKLRKQNSSTAQYDVLGIGSPTGPMPPSPVRGSYIASLLPQPPVSKTATVVAAGELERVAEILGPGRAKMLIGPQATKSNLFGAKPEDYRVLIFATHGYLASEVLELSEPSLLMSADSREQPPVFLTASDIASRRIDANLILLNACNTAGSDGLLGSEAMTGLASAFFFSGARSIVASLWPVVDNTATHIGVDIFDQAVVQADAGVASLLQQSMLMSLQSAHEEAKHPFYWAPYVLVGDPVVVPLGGPKASP